MSTRREETTRPASTSPAATDRAHGGPGPKAGEGPTCSTAAPTTLPAPDGFPTARLVLPADAPEEQWHATRLLGLGGSDIAAVLGMHRWKGPLHVWEEKHGRGDHSDSEAAECGRELEDSIARIFGRRTGLEITPSPGTLQNLEHAWMLANIDRLVVERTPTLGYPTVVPLECKNRSEYQARQWDEDVPDEPALQAHWYTAVTGASHAYVAALIGGNRLRWYRLERDQELIEHLIDFCGNWWLEHIVEATPPSPDGSKATTDLLAHLWDVQPGKSAEVDPVESMMLMQRRLHLKARIEADTGELAEVENQMKVALGDAEIATVGHRTIYRWPQNGTFAPVRFREEEPELAAEYTHLVPAIDTDRLAAEKPEIYRKYRARVLRVPSEG